VKPGGPQLLPQRDAVGRGQLPGQQLRPVGRVALTVRFASSALARWERESQGGADVVAPLASFTLILTDLAVAMLDAPSSCLVTGAGGPDPKPCPPDRAFSVPSRSR